jgi:hypothetical protein
MSTGALRPPLAPENEQGEAPARPPAANERISPEAGAAVSRLVAQLSVEDSGPSDRGGPIGVAPAGTSRPQVTVNSACGAIAAMAGWMTRRVVTSFPGQPANRPAKCKVTR